MSQKNSKKTSFASFTQIYSKKATKNVTKNEKNIYLSGWNSYTSKLPLEMSQKIQKIPSHIRLQVLQILATGNVTKKLKEIIFT